MCASFIHQARRWKPWGFVANLRNTYTLAYSHERGDPLPLQKRNPSEPRCNVNNYKGCQLLSLFLVALSKHYFASGMLVWACLAQSKLVVMAGRNSSIYLLKTPCAFAVRSPLVTGAVTKRHAGTEGPKKWDFEHESSSSSNSGNKHIW